LTATSGLYDCIACTDATGTGAIESSNEGILVISFPRKEDSRRILPRNPGSRYWMDSCWYDGYGQAGGRLFRRRAIETGTLLSAELQLACDVIGAHWRKRGDGVRARTRRTSIRI
jgi:hypothetical protein